MSRSLESTYTALLLTGPLLSLVGLLFLFAWANCADSQAAALACRANPPPNPLLSVLVGVAGLIMVAVGLGTAAVAEP